jgi:hypothetical protein
MSNGVPHPDSPLSDDSLSAMPRDELIGYASQLGIETEPRTETGELLRHIRQRQKLLASLDREHLLEVVMWARRPVRKSASKEELAREITLIRRSHFAGLSDHGLRALALLRGVAVEPPDTRDAIVRKLRRKEGLLDKLKRKRNRLIGSLLGSMIDSPDPGEYKFLPEHSRPLTLQERIEDEGLVRGVTDGLRGAADSYVRTTLDEIERRIDQKLDQIDQRLAEWRDREVKNRLKIIRITLWATLIVACLSLGYTYVRDHYLRSAPTPVATPADGGQAVPGTSSTADR